MTAKKTAQKTEDNNVDSNGQKEKICFIVAPIGSNGTETRRSTDGLVRAVFKPLFQDVHGYRVEIAHELLNRGSISEQIINRLLEAELVVVDLTDLNPNVMYELAVRHCIGLPLIVIAKDGTPLPFDVGHERTIFYHNDMQGVVDLKLDLESAITHIHDTNGVMDTPVSRARKSQSLKDSMIQLSGENVEIIPFMLDQINELKSLIMREVRVDGRSVKKDLGRITIHSVRVEALKMLLINSGFLVSSIKDFSNDDGVEFSVEMDQDLEEENIRDLSKLFSRTKKSSADNYIVNARNGVFVF